MKKISIFLSLPISLRVTLKLSLRSRFSAKKYFFVFCQKFCFNVEKLSNHYSQLKKHLKVDPETRSYDFLTRTHEKIPTIPNMTEVQTTLENRMNFIAFSKVAARSVLFRDIGFSKGSDTQNHLYHNENLFRSIDMMWVLFDENYF